MEDIKNIFSMLFQSEYKFFITPLIIAYLSFIYQFIELEILVFSVISGIIISLLFYSFVKGKLYVEEVIDKIANK